VIGAVDIGGTKIAVGVVDDNGEGAVQVGVSDRRCRWLRKRTCAND